MIAKKFFICLFIGMMTGSYSYASLLQGQGYDVTAEDIIRLGTEQSPVKSRTSPSPIIFRAIKNGVLINISASRPAGMIALKITDEFGREVYHGFMDTAVGREYQIDIAGWEAGSYTLYVESPGRSLSGRFEIVEYEEEE